jgi:bisphosphoglycerate-independent phosphoglycerate mutase (AlkP superfamily)
MTGSKLTLVCRESRLSNCHGTKRPWEYTANYDGKDNRITGNNPDADMVARTRVNATTIQSVNKKDGKVTTTNTSVISSDGKTRTIATKGTNGQGQTVNNVGVYEKQEIRLRGVVSSGGEAGVTTLRRVCPVIVAGRTT